MKVGTDGVLLGTWTDSSNVKAILDIGTGTGLIALMLAQKNRHANIHAIDISPDAIEQAEDNICESPFSEQITCQVISLQDFGKQYTQKYDLIVSNPPFFIQSLKSPDRGRSLARHTDSLLIEELISISSTLLNADGRLSIIYPYEHKDTLIKLAVENGLSPYRITHVYPTPGSSAKRILLELSKSTLPLLETTLVIEKERHHYSDDFQSLVKDFYLKL